jgi:hypothetical protein
MAKLVEQVERSEEMIEFMEKVSKTVDSKKLTMEGGSQPVICLQELTKAVSRESYLHGRSHSHSAYVQGHQILAEVNLRHWFCMW